MYFNKQILNSIQESVQVWDKNGTKLFCNDKASKLYELADNEIQTIQDVLHKWDFFDGEDRHLSIEMLPAFQVIQSKQTINDTILKMVSKKDTKWIKTSVTPIFQSNGDIECIVTTCLDITHLKNKELKYKNIANYDALTKLPNRLLLSDRLNLAVVHAQRNKTHIAVCMIDLDGFKGANDIYGHQAGDTLLVEVSKRMKEAVRSDDTVARLGGDEFVVVLTDLVKSEDCVISLYKLLNAIKAPYTIDGHTINTISASIGVALYPLDNVEGEILLRHADVAMYKSKNSGKNKFSFFDIASDSKIKANYKALNKIKHSLENNEFCLYYQPKVNSVSGQIIEVEALARWNHPLLGLMQPNEFLPLVENDNELSDIFDDWVVGEAIRQLGIWQKEGLVLKICVNISPKQFKHKDFVEKLKEQFVKNKLSFELLSHLEFEILETDVVENLDRSNSIVNECKKLGVTFALDDFGTGYSSLRHLKELNVDTVKIDRSFVSNMLECSEDMAIVQAITALASAFDISVTAEGAENIEQVLSLMEMGCDEIQGYAIAKPMPASDVIRFIANFTPDPRWKIAATTLPSRADFELLLAESNHKYWVENIITQLSKPNPDSSIIKRNHTNCRFGQWFEKNRNRNYKFSPSFKNLDEIHQEIHNYTRDIYNTLEKEKRVLSDEEIENIQNLSLKLTLILDSIRNEVEKIKKQQSVVNKILQKRENYGK